MRKKKVLRIDMHLQTFIHLYLSILVIAKVPQRNQSVDEWHHLLFFVVRDFFLGRYQVLSGHHRRNSPSVERIQEK